MAETGHGKSVAAWTAVGILIFAAAVISLGIGFEVLWVTIVGVVLVFVGVIAGKVLSMAGFGEQKPERPHGADAAR